MKIFITGGTGFIGKPTVSNLKNKGHDLLVLSRKSHKSAKSLKFVKGDLNDASWQSKVKRFKPDACIHLAWQDLPNYGAQASVRNLFLSVKNLDSFGIAHRTIVIWH